MTIDAFKSRFYRWFLAVLHAAAAAVLVLAWADLPTVLRPIVVLAMLWSLAAEWRSARCLLRVSGTEMAVCCTGRNWRGRREDQQSHWQPAQLLSVARFAGMLCVRFRTQGQGGSRNLLLFPDCVQGYSFRQLHLQLNALMQSQ